MLQSDSAFTVSQLNSYVKDVLWKDELLRQVLVRGEIANIRNYQGHLYFTLKDQKCSVKAVMWRTDAARLTFVPTDGSEVLVAGNVSVFERDGVYQVYATYMEPSGLGALYAALERLKQRLEAEGLFAEERKRPLPAFPRTIGLVTSIRGAAIKDIVSVGRRRYPGVAFAVADTKVQGDGAAKDIARGIRTLNELPEVDVIVVGRGGGSQEDLWVFNDEVVARAIYSSRAPVVSAVGHERDFTVADLVADARAATPSQAAEMVVPNAIDLRQEVQSFEEGMRNQVYTLIGGLRQTLSLLRQRPALERPDWFLVSSRESLVRLREDLEDAVQALLERARAGLANVASSLDALSPLQILSRGFSLARRAEDGAIVRDHKDAPAGTRLDVSLFRGSLRCLVEDSRPPEEGK
ncbi:MAG: exodeoxyribonuclease VII large subunit [Bacillota bacterium]